MKTEHHSIKNAKNLLCELISYFFSFHDIKALVSYQLTKKATLLRLNIFVECNICGIWRHKKVSIIHTFNEINLRKFNGNYFFHSTANSKDLFYFSSTGKIHFESKRKHGNLREKCYFESSLFKFSLRFSFCLKNENK